MCRLLLLVPLLLAASAAAQLSSGDTESPTSALRAADGLPSGEEIAITRRSAEGSGSGESEFRTLQCACVVIDKIEAFQFGNDTPADTPADEQQQEEDFYRHRRQADETEGSGSSQGPFAFVHQPTSRSDDSEQVDVITVHRIVVCNCGQGEEASGSGEIEVDMVRRSAVASGDDSEIMSRSEASGEQSAVRSDGAFLSSGAEESADVVRRSALDTQEASGEEEEGLPTISTASTPELSTLSTPEVSTISVPTLSTTAFSTASTPTLASNVRRSAEESAEEASGEETSDLRAISVATLPPVSIGTLPPVSVATLPPVSVATLPPASIGTLPPVSVATLAPLTRALRHAESSGMMEEEY